MERKESPLNLKDLNLLMESHKNSIELSTILVEQHKQILQHLEQVIEIENDICNSLNKNKEYIAEYEKTIIDYLKDCNATSTLNLEKKINTVKSLLYGSYTGLVLIIISLIGLIVTIVGKT